MGCVGRRAQAPRHRIADSPAGAVRRRQQPQVQRCGQLEGEAIEGPASPRALGSRAQSPSAIGSGGRGDLAERMMHERHVGSRAGNGERDVG